MRTVLIRAPGCFARRDEIKGHAVEVLLRVLDTVKLGQGGFSGEHKQLRVVHTAALRLEAVRDVAVAASGVPLPRLDFPHLRMMKLWGIIIIIMA